MTFDMPPPPAIVIQVGDMDPKGFSDNPEMLKQIRQDLMCQLHRVRYKIRAGDSSPELRAQENKIAAIIGNLNQLLPPEDRIIGFELRDKVDNPNVCPSI